MVLTNYLDKLQWKLHWAIPEAGLVLLLAWRSLLESGTASYQTKPSYEFYSVPFEKVQSVCGEGGGISVYIELQAFFMSVH